MATKKAASSKKVKTVGAKKHTTSKVTSVKTVAADAPVRARTPKRTAILQGRSPLLGAGIGEFIGTFLLASAIVLTKGEPLYAGFVLVAIVLVLGALSGAHVNPLVTIGAWATRKISGKRALAYIFAQALGAMLALVVLTAFAGAAPKADPQAAMFGQQTASLFKANEIAQGKEWFVFFAEMLGAAIFGLAVSSAMREKRDRLAQAVTVGFGLLLAVLVAGVCASFASSSAIVNPAVAITLQAINWSFSSIWPILVYIVAPIVGGTIGFFLYDVVRGESDGGDDHLLNDSL